MKLLKKWFNRHHDNGNRVLVKRDDQSDGLARFRDRFSEAFDRFWHEFERDPLAASRQWMSTGGWPAMDMTEDDKGVSIRLDVPGLDPEDVKVEVSGNVLIVRGQRREEWSDQDKGVHRRERRFGSFMRSVTLPSWVNADQIEARYDKGILTLQFPRKAGQTPRRVPVKAG